ncbi:MAG TPA: biotin/lipoyl-containing protein [Rhodothermales bacterium]|nr:biotin/lipoyl-containing protein [Rhodothermales bacterium]
MTSANGDAVPGGTFRAEVGGEVYDVRFEGERLFVNGVRAEVSFEEVGAGYFSLLVDGQSLGLAISRAPDGSVRVIAGGREIAVRVSDEQDLLFEKLGVGKAGAAMRREVHAPMPGLVLSVHVEPGQTVSAGEGLLVLEAMKMENELKAPADGKIRSVPVRAGEAVVKGQLMVAFE